MEKKVCSRQKEVSAWVFQGPLMVSFILPKKQDVHLGSQTHCFLKLSFILNPSSDRTGEANDLFRITTKESPTWGGYWKLKGRISLKVEKSLLCLCSTKRWREGAQSTLREELSWEQFLTKSNIAESEGILEVANMSIQRIPERSV